MFVLHSHPQTPCAAVDALSVEVIRGTGATLELRYELKGRIEALRLPDAGLPQRTDELWRHTCFELFFAADTAGPYCELNFSPSLGWAAYQFDSYRSGMRRLSLPQAPRLQCEHDATRLVLTATIMLPPAAAAAAAAASTMLRVAPGAVIEAASGALSYWALRHASALPDFHDAAGFVALAA